MMRGASLRYWAVLSQVAILMAACGDDDEPAAPTGGAGGEAGARPGDGGASDTGGRPSTGGGPTAPGGEGGASDVGGAGGAGGFDGIGGASAGEAGQTGEAGSGGDAGGPATSVCSPNPCRNGATCSDELGGFVCDCPDGFSGALCDTNIDDCADDPCRNGGTCVDGTDEYTCTCLAGFTGPSCETTVSSCDDEPCKNGATCTDEAGGYVCECTSGYYGANCDTACPSGHCVGPVTCEAADGSDSSCQFCEPGYEGRICTVEIDECDEAPCQNGGVCTDLLADYSCACPATWTGKSCNVDVNECMTGTHTCHELACDNTIGGFTCECPEGFVGDGVTCTPHSCAVLRWADPDAKTGPYVIDVDGSDPREPFEVYCDMDADRAGYTLYRIDDVALAADQTAYRDACAAVGLEVVVPRTAAHLDAIRVFNGGVLPNLVNVFPMVDGAVGASQFTGLCRGRECSFFLSETDTTDCTSDEPNGNNTTEWSLYRANDDVSCEYGIWDDALNQVAVHDYVVCSTNDAGPLRSCQDIALLADMYGAELPPAGTAAIDPDGDGPLPERDVWCDMSHEGGGWTLLLASNGAGPDELTPADVDELVSPDSGSYLPGEFVAALAKVSTSVHIRTRGLPDDASVTSFDPQVIINLRNLVSLEQDTGPSFFYGPFSASGELDLDDPCPASAYPDIYQACGNPNGLHLFGAWSGWTQASGVELEVYVR